MLKHLKTATPAISHNWQVTLSALIITAINALIVGSKRIRSDPDASIPAQKLLWYALNACISGATIP